MLLKGISVILYNRIRTGQNELGEDVYNEVPETVEDVLVASSTNEDLINDIRLYGIF